jgi:predicted phosphodiesterase
MSRIGLISDIHGNLLALEAVLAELERDELDGLICLGDVAAGPRPHETLARVRGLGCPIVMGNWDAWFLDRPPPPQDDIGLKLHEITSFWAEELDDYDLAYLRSFVPRLELPLENAETALCFHGSPTSYDDFIFATTPDEELGRMLGGARAEVLIGGHAHLQLLRRFFFCGCGARRCLRPLPLSVSPRRAGGLPAFGSLAGQRTGCSSTSRGGCESSSGEPTTTSRPCWNGPSQAACRTPAGGWIPGAKRRASRTLGGCRPAPVGVRKTRTETDYVSSVATR